MPIPLRPALVVFLLCALTTAAEQSPLFYDDFSRDPTANRRWVFTHDAQCPREGTYDPDQGLAAGGSLRVASNRSWYWARWQTAETFAVEPGRMYRISGHIRAENVRSGIPYIGIWFLDAGGRRVGGVSTAPVYEPDWTLVTAEGAAPAAAVAGRVICEASGLNGTAWYDQIAVNALPQPGLWREDWQVDGSPHGLAPGATLTAKLALRNPFPDQTREFTATWTLRDVSGRTAQPPQEQEITLTDTHTLLASFGPLEHLGFLRLEVAVAEDGHILLSEQADVPVMAPLPETPLPPVPFNVIAANQYALVKGALQDNEASWRQFARMMRAAGVTDLRLWNHWTEHIHPQGQEPRFAPSTLDLASRVAHEEGIQVSMALWHRGVPQWVRDDGYDWHSYRIMQAMSRYYQGFGVVRFEVDNEPSRHPPHTDLLKGGYVGVKQGNPAAEALMAGMFWAHRRTYEDAFHLAGSALNDVGVLASAYTDRINWHEYYSSPPEGESVHRLRGDLRLHRDLADRYYDGAYGESLFQTETAYRAFEGASRPLRHFTEYEQAYLAQRLYLLTLRSNYLDMDNKAFWYYYLDDSRAPMCAWSLTGFLRLDMAPKPSYVAMRNLAAQIEGAEPVGAIEAGPQRWVWVFRRGATPVIAAWTVAGAETLTLDVGTERVTVIDMWGNTDPVDAPGGRLTLTITPQLQFIQAASPAHVYAPALAHQLNHLQGELAAVFADWPSAAPLAALVSATAARLADGPPADSATLAPHLAQLAVTAETLVDDMIAQMGQGTLTMEQARPRWAVLRLADLARLGMALLAPADTSVAEAIAAAEARAAQVAELLPPLDGRKRSRLFLMLGQRRLARAQWQAAQGWDAAVTAETARLAARDLALASRLAEHEPDPRLDVWLSAPSYLLQSELLPAEFEIAVNNASQIPASGPFVWDIPTGWRINGPAAFAAPAQQRATYRFTAEPTAAASEPAVLQVRGRLDAQLTTPIAFGLTVATTIEARYHLSGNGLDVRIVNQTAQALPASVLMVSQAEPRYVALPELEPGAGVTVRLRTTAPLTPQSMLSCRVEGPQVRWRGRAVYSATELPAPRTPASAPAALPTAPWLVVGPFDNPQEDVDYMPFPDKGHEVDYLTEHGGELAIEPQVGMTHASRVAPGGAARWQTYQGDGRRVNLGALWSAADPRVAYLATTIEAETETLLVLETGSSGGLKAFWNGRMVLDQPQRRRFSPTEDQTVVLLRPGPNRLLLKSTHGQGEWVVSGRLLLPAGLESADGHVR